MQIPKEENVFKMSEIGCMIRFSSWHHSPLGRRRSGVHRPEDHLVHRCRSHGGIQLSLMTHSRCGQFLCQDVSWFCQASRKDIGLKGCLSQSKGTP